MATNTRIRIDADIEAYIRSQSERVMGEHPNFARRQEKGNFIRELSSRINSGLLGIQAAKK